MSEQDGTSATTFQRPSNDDKEAWKDYWKVLGQSWRNEPEIGQDRQKFLTSRRGITPSIEQGIYPFKGIEPKLTRADIEWLLATHENGRGPVDWSDGSQREREGLDLRGADLCRVDLQSLPLACMRGGLNRSERNKATLEQGNIAQIHLEKAILSFAHLEGASFILAHLEEVNLYQAHLEGADLYRAHLEGAFLYKTHLGEASLRNAFFDPRTVFQYVILEKKELGIVKLSDIHWGDMNLSLANWAQIKILGDEYEALQLKRWDGETKSKEDQLRDYRRAVRAYRQLAVVLRGQGLNEEGARFAYRGQMLQRKVFRYQGKFGQYLFSLFLDLLAGYGYKPWRSFVAYLLVITAFAIAYFIIGHRVGPVISPLSSFVFSMTSFHGRGFFPGGIGLDDPLTVLAALEAFVGLLIEVTFIATLTQRFFGK